jgi:hypothetical protein
VTRKRPPKVVPRKRPELDPESRAYVDALVKAAPPLTAAQRDVIRGAFSGTGRDAGRTR